VTRYGGIPPYAQGSETSALAALRMRGPAASLRERIYDYIVDRGRYGATRDEIEADLKLRGNTVRPRCRELEEVGRVLKTPNRRKTRSGRDAVVYVAVHATPQIEMGV